MNSTTFRLPEQEVILANSVYTGNYMITGLREVTYALFLFSSSFPFSRAMFFNGGNYVMQSSSTDLASCLHGTSDNMCTDMLY